MKPRLILLTLLATTWNSGVPAASGNGDIPVAPSPSDITIEAESFTRQSKDSIRRWEILKERPGASGGAYIKALPDTRVTHADKLIKGENFADEPGTMAVLEYEIEVKEAGRYHVWARMWSSGSEDNGLHFGLNGKWPASGQRWQTVKKDGWHWDCAQRTSEVHSGVPMQLWLDIDQPGKHTLMLSMREDGAEVDQISLRKGGVPAASGKGDTPAAQSNPVPRQPNGDATLTLTGELKQWHKVTLTLDGPFAAETDGLGGEDAAIPCPFTDLAFEVTFTHESGSPSYQVPGYFAADGNAADTSAESGTKWRAHLSPDKPGTWTYTTSFTQGKHAALDGGGAPLAPYHGKTGSFKVAPTDKTGRDFRAEGRLQYVGKHHLQFAGSKRYFLKAGADAPETLLGYADFDGTVAGKPNKVPLKNWAPHVQDWREGDPAWQNGKGKGLIGALNYLATKGANAFSFLTYNAGGDGDNVWPFIRRDTKLHYDCSKLDQWGIVFDHATTLGLYSHFKLQETENDDLKGPGAAQALDGGDLGPERKLYCREMIARFGHLLALNWNIGEENTQNTEQINDMIGYLRAVDPYQHHVVIHTYPNEQDKVYLPLIGEKSQLSGISLQNSNVKDCHWQVVKWTEKSRAAGRPWVVAFDEPGDATYGMPPDDDWPGMDKLRAEDKEGKIPTVADIRKYVLWGTLMAGGMGVEYYFGYKLPENDLVCEDFRSRDQSWDYCRIALNFFREHNIPFADMQNANALIGNSKNNNDKYCLAKPGELYLVYLPKGGSSELDLSGADGNYALSWLNPRKGGPPLPGAATLAGGAPVKISAPDQDDWLALIRRQW